MSRMNFPVSNTPASVKKTHRQRFLTEMDQVVHWDGLTLEPLNIALAPSSEVYSEPTSHSLHQVTAFIPNEGRYARIISRTFAVNKSNVNGLVINCIPGSRNPPRTAACSA
jgi:hypothetical protein